MAKKVVDVNSLKKGSYVLIGDEPCKVLDTQKSKSGKHGHAKVRMTVVGLFDGSKRSVVYPGSKKLDAPVIDKRNGMVLSIQTDSVQIMDLETNETLEITKPSDEEIIKQLTEGGSVEYWIIMGTKTIIRAKR